MSGVVPTDWELSFIVNCYKRNSDAFDWGNYMDLKMIDQVMKVVESSRKANLRKGALYCSELMVFSLDLCQDGVLLIQYL